MIGIIGAMEDEVAELKKSIGNRRGCFGGVSFFLQRKTFGERSCRSKERDWQGQCRSVCADSCGPVWSGCDYQYRNRGISGCGD